jgi:hypothetical protein
MGFLDFLKRQRSHEKHWPAKVYFLDEQDGVGEQDLKRALAAVLRRNPDVKRAYLVLVQYDRQDTTHVALCLEAGTPQKTLIDAVSKEFAEMFSKAQHLDVLYLSAAQRQEVWRVAKPFYARTAESLQDQNKNGHS